MRDLLGSPFVAPLVYSSKNRSLKRGAKTLLIGFLKYVIYIMEKDQGNVDFKSFEYD